MSPYGHLRDLRERVPGWLGGFSVGDSFPREEFFRSRIVFYPGSGVDGHPVKLFGSTHSAHCFVYADYFVKQAELEEQLADPLNNFYGYHTLARLQLKERDLVPRGWVAHVRPEDLPAGGFGFAPVAESPFGFLEVLERNQDLDERHGAHRLAILFLGADGIATYDALFCQTHSVSPPFAVILQDHGFGCNYNKFGQGGLLERIAKCCPTGLPDWLVVAKNTTPWPGFMKAGDGGRGGMHSMRRYLYIRRESEGM